MKKMNVNIASPCHENWDAMTETDKGKFCASCQKTVVDFTNMSDREIIEFLSKSKGSVCGRLTDEQLSKDLVIPSRPIPWVKYFFRITFPAFIMSLKSCIPNTDSKLNTTKNYSLLKRNKDRNATVIGDTTYVRSNVNCSNVFMGAIVGFTIPKFDTGKIKNLAKQILKKSSANKHKTNIEPISLIDSAQIQSIAAENIKECFNPDQVLSGHLGGLSYTSIKVLPKPVKLIKKAIDTINILSSSPKIQLYPNPISSNSRLNIKLINIKQGDYLLSLITPNGIIIQNQEVKIDPESNVINMDLKTLLAGTYIVRMVDKVNGKSIAQKLVVF